MRIQLSFSAILFAAQALAADAPKTTLDQAWWSQDPAAQIRAAEFGDRQKHSYYVPMRDGVKLAVDVWLPANLPAGTRLPAILEQTRYYRSGLVKSDPSGACRPAGAAGISLFVTHGYAYVIVDVRGSGASFGTRAGEYSADEVKDGGEIVDWIVRQDWSSGAVGSTGQSYVGTTSELLLANHHPAVRAVAPTFSGYDFYSEIVAPGGIPNAAFTSAWSQGNAQLDAGTPPDASPILGPCPVDGDTGGAQLRAAIAQHAGNFKLQEFLDHVSYRDDRYQGRGADDASPYRLQREIDASQVPLYAMVGWYDSGYALAAIRRWINSSSLNQRLLIGPWNHGARYYYAPGIYEPTQASFSIAAEKLRFFDYYLKGIDAHFSAEPRIHYYSSGANQWRAAAQWPPVRTAPLTLYFAGPHALAATPQPGGSDGYTYASEAPMVSSELNRWHTTMGPYPVAYPDRADEDGKLLVYTSAALEHDTEVTGSPALMLWAAANQPGADFIAYLEEVTAGGQVNYVSEGELRAQRRRPGALPFRSPAPTHSDRRGDRLPMVQGKAMELAIALQPLSHVFARGSRIRIALAPADRSQFTQEPGAPFAWLVYRKPGMQSRVVLPVVDLPR